MGKGSTFGGPPAAAAAAETEDLNVEELADLMNLIDLPPVVRRRVDALQNLQKKYLTLDKQYHAEVRELERKYKKLYEPLFTKRAEIAAGSYEPTNEEAHVERTPEEEEALKKDASPKDSEIKGIPQFWLSVLSSNSVVERTIVETDHEALTYLHDIRYSELEGDSEGFTLTFHFAENPYFSNAVLSKTYHMDPDEMFGELQYDHATGTKIEWKAGKNLTVKQVKKKSKAKGKKAPRVITVEEPQDSFFSFFAPPQPPTDEEEQMEEEEAALMEYDWEIGCIIKDKLIPFAVKWFTGEAQEYDDDDDDEFDEGDEDEDDEGDEDEEDEEDDDDAPPAPKRGGRGHAGHQFAPPAGAKPSAGAPAQPQQPECKQQ